MTESGADPKGSRALLIESARKFGGLLGTAGTKLKTSADRYAESTFTSNQLQDRYVKIEDSLKLAMAHMNVIMRSCKDLQDTQKLVTERLQYLENIKAGITDPAGRVASKCGEDKVQ